MSRAASSALGVVCVALATAAPARADPHVAVDLVSAAVETAVPDLRLELDATGTGWSLAWPLDFTAGFYEGDSLRAILTPYAEPQVDTGDGDSPAARRSARLPARQGL
jgi:hypothetical protein